MRQDLGKSCQMTDPCGDKNLTKTRTGLCPVQANFCKFPEPDTVRNQEAGHWFSAAACTARNIKKFISLESLRIGQLSENIFSAQKDPEIACLSLKVRAYCTNPINSSVTRHRGSEIDEILRGHRSQGPATKPPASRSVWRRAKLGSFFVRNRFFFPL